MTEDQERSVAGGRFKPSGKAEQRAVRRQRSENRNQDAGKPELWEAIAEAFWPHGTHEHQDVLQMKPSLDKHGPHASSHRAHMASALKVTSSTVARRPRGKLLTTCGRHGIFLTAFSPYMCAMARGECQNALY